MDKKTDYDVIIVGGGLAGGLIALALAARRQEVSVCVVDAGEALGGNHVWSFFDSDVSPADRWLVEPLICHRWDSYDVAFPAHRRELRYGYNAVESEHFDKVVRAALTEGTIVRAEVSEVSGTEIALADGRLLTTHAVIDARGPGNIACLEVGWQKFVGQLLHLDAPHGLTRPVVMDATVDQVDGYRFVYLLPFTPNSVFVEDTYYSDTPDLDVEAIKVRIGAYADARGWRATTSNRLETGVLPVVVKGSFDEYWASTGHGPAKAGMRAGLFHPTTGYSLPDAVRLASRIAASPHLDGDTLERLTHDFAAQQWKKRGFYRLLDIMLFRAAFPYERYRIMERFYRLGPGLIGRFYAGRSTLYDQLRILSGKPPIPIPRAVRAILKELR